MTVVNDLYFLDQFPGVGQTIGLAGSGADVIINPMEQTATHLGNYGYFFDSAGTTTEATFDLNGVTYETNAIEEVTFTHAGGSSVGFVLMIAPTGGGAQQVLFLPNDAGGDLNLGAFTITSSVPLLFVDDQAVQINNTHSFVTCFAAGTLIMTLAGPVPVEEIGPGDLVLTADHGPRPCLLRLDRTVRAATALPEAQAPVFVPAHAFGPGLPLRPLHVSRQHRLLLRGPEVLALTGHAEVLVAAKDLCGWNGVTIARHHREMRYVHLVLATHEVIWAEGLPTESFFAGDIATKAAEEALRGLTLSDARARPFVRGRQARALIRRLNPLPPQETVPRRQKAQEDGSDQLAHGDSRV